jgi:GDSL-like Lipase/Acylhydrolase family
MPLRTPIRSLARVFLSVALLLPLMVITGLHLRNGEDPLSPFPWDPDMISLQIKKADKHAQTVLLGDSLVARWSYRQTLWNKLCRPANLGVGGLNTASLLWLVRSDKLAGFHPKLWVILIGSNDIGIKPAKFWQQLWPTPERIAMGVSEVVKTLKERDPESRVVVTALPPRHGGLLTRHYKSGKDGSGVGEGTLRRNLVVLICILHAHWRMCAPGVPQRLTS